MAIKSWNPQPPSPSKLKDHEVPMLRKDLVGKRIALLVCGGIGAMRSPFIARALRKCGAEVFPYMSNESQRYVTSETLEWACDQTVVISLTTKSEHLNNSTPFDAYLVVPATYNTINKMRFGIADTSVTNLLAASLRYLEDGKTQILLAPTMHGSMHNSILHESLVDLKKRGVFLIPPRDENGKHNVPEDQVIIDCVCKLIGKTK